MLLSGLPIQAANISVIPNSDQITIQLPYLQNKNCWCSIDSHFDLLSIENLLQSIIVFIMFWTYSLSSWQIETWPCGKAEPRNILALFALILLKFIYLAKTIIAPAIHLFINWYSQATAHHWPIIYLSMKLTVMLHKEAGDTSWCVSYYVFSISILLVASIVLTITNTFPACQFDFRVSQINLEKFCAAHTSCRSELSGSSMQSPHSESDSTSASQSSSLSFGLHKLPYQTSQFPVTKILPGAPSASLSTGWRSILPIWQPFNIWVRPPVRYFAEKTWWQMWSFWQFECSCTVTLREWPRCVDDLIHIRNVSQGCHSPVLSARFLSCSALVVPALPPLQNVVDLGHSVRFPVVCHGLYFRVIFWVHRMQC